MRAITDAWEAKGYVMDKVKALQALLDDLTKSEIHAEQEGWIDGDELERELERDLNGGEEK